MKTIRKDLYDDIARSLANARKENRQLRHLIRNLSLIEDDGALRASVNVWAKELNGGA